MANHTVSSNDHSAKLTIEYNYREPHKLWDENKKLLKDKKRSDPLVLFNGDKSGVGAADVIKVPDPKQVAKNGAIDAKHKYKLGATKLFMRLRIVNNDMSPAKDAEYFLKINGHPTEIKGKTDAKGHIEVEIPGYFTKRDTGYATTADLVVRVKAAQTDGPSAESSGSGGSGGGGGGGSPPPAVKPKPEVRGDVVSHWILQIGRLNPINEIAPNVDCLSGAQQRLNNLNINTGPVDGILGPNTRSAIKFFKTLYKVPMNSTDEGLSTAAFQDKLAAVHDAETPPAPPAPASSSDTST
jgi:hypothetical protein